jgi:hypothetical protein
MSNTDNIEPKSYTLADILVTAKGTGGDVTLTLEEWQDRFEELETIKVTDAEDTKKEFEFDDPTGRPRDVVVYTNGRPPADAEAPVPDISSLLIDE